MGMYTEIYVKVTFKEETPTGVIDILRHMMGHEDAAIPESLPQHPLFSKDRWKFMLRCCSFYHMPDSVGQFWYDKIGEQWYLLNRSDLKNYENEIEAFFDWISPYVEMRGNDKTFIGYELYEECDVPTMYYLVDNGRGVYTVTTTS